MRLIQNFRIATARRRILVLQGIVLFALALYMPTTHALAQEAVQPKPAVDSASPSPGATGGPVVTPGSVAPPQAREQAETSVPAAPLSAAPASAASEPTAASPQAAQPEISPGTASQSEPSEQSAAVPPDDAVATAPPHADAQSAPTSSEPPVTEAAPHASKKAPHDLSPWGMFMAADIIVKAVMVGLAAASFITWTIWVAKSFEITTAKWRLKRAIRSIKAAPDLGSAVEAFAKSRSTGAVMVRSAAGEVNRSAPVLDIAGPDGIKERVASRLSRVEANASRRMTLGTGVLATIGSTAPFVGLFGTVWGIMNSFIGISEAQTTNLAVVAPGIAEALLATAIGLVAAIPAVVIYNAFARSIAGYRLMLSDASAGVERLVSWELDAYRVPQSSVPHVHAQAAE